MIKSRHYLIVLLGILLGACAPETLQECTLPPSGFSESDLIGTWSAMESWGNSTIKVGADGRYRQTMYVERTGFMYESDWNPWRITYSDKGLPYLHLEGLLMCAYWSQIDCSTGGTSITPDASHDTKDVFAAEYYWYDSCQKKWVYTPGEGVFTVRRGEEFMPRNIALVPFTKSSDTNTGSAFILKGP